MSSNTPSHAWSIAVSVYGDEAVKDANFARSPSLATAEKVFVQSSFMTVVAAYNDALDKCETDVLAFAHPDVYLPQPFERQLQAALTWLEQNDPNWAVLGLVGCDDGSGYVGFTYSAGWGRFIGKPFTNPEPVRTLDEFVFIVRKSSGLRFDEELPGPQSQLCTPDICLQARQKGMGVYAIPAFALHNSNGWKVLPFGFWKPYLYMRRKWKRELPIRVPYARITKWCVPMMKNTLRSWLKYRKSGHRVDTRVADVEALYQRIRNDTVGAFMPESRDLGPAKPAAKTESA